MQASSCKYLGLDLYEDNFRVKTLTNQAERENAYRLRHKIFVNELNWVPPQVDELEIDVYDDERMVPLAILNQTGKVIAHLRITLPHRTFMMEEEFSALIEKKISKTDDTVEISRVCTRVDTRRTLIMSPYGRQQISMLLYKGLYSWCCQNCINYMCMVIEAKLYRLLRMTGFPCRQLGDITIMPDGVSAVAVSLSWREFELLNQNNNPQLLAWFSSTNTMEKAA